ncbi:MAG: imelysin family protein [Paracoccus sp. (in: a-proteobacteria)]
MKRILWIWGLAVMAAVPVHADVAELSADVVTPAYARFAEAAAKLDQAAQADCSASALREPYQEAWDAWAAIDFLHLGPVEDQGRSLAIAFWPDKKSSGLRTQQGLIDADSPVIGDPEAFASISVAARGLSGLERLIYAGALKGDEAALCRLRQATAADLARMAAEIRDEWPGYATLLLTAGQAGNTAYLTEDEARQAAYTQLVAGLEYLADTRLGRPLGAPERPRPERAESLAAKRGARNVALSLRGMRDYALALYPDAPATASAFERAIAMAENLEDPALAGAADPRGRARIVALQYAVRDAKYAVETEIGEALGLDVGFNSQDGD